MSLRYIFGLVNLMPQCVSYINQNIPAYDMVMVVASIVKCCAG